MKKFFLFRREQITLFSSNASEDGAGLAVLAIPADKLSFMTAGIGSVQMNFDDASVYDYITLPESDVIDKTHVVVSCAEGDEVSLMISVMNFISSDSKKNILRFDAVTGESTLSEAKVDEFNDVSSIVNTAPVNIITQRADTSASVIADIDFLTAANLPFIDFNHEGITQSQGQHVSSWANAATATGGNAYDSTDEGTSNVTAQTSGDTSYVDTKSANISSGNYFRLGTEFRHHQDYTMYCAFGLSTYAPIQPIYGDANGTQGFANGRFDVVSMIYDGLTGLPATVRTDNTDSGSVSYRLPDPNLEVDANKAQTLYAFVIRRDSDFNIFVHAYDGDVVAIIPAKTGGVSSTAGRTDEDLVLAHFGGTNPDYEFQGYLSRFGIIKRDIGYTAGRKLAQDLYQLYAYNPNFN
jgi:hypothetical protein